MFLKRFIPDLVRVAASLNDNSSNEKSTVLENLKYQKIQTVVVLNNR